MFANKIIMEVARTGFAILGADKNFAALVD